MIVVRPNQKLMEHLRTYEYDGATVDSLLFEGGRLAYPGRKEIEHQLGYIEPYTLELEARVIEGLSPKMVAAIRLLSREAMCIPGPLKVWSHDDADPTLELLWMAHGSWDGAPSFDRLVAALVMIEYTLEAGPQGTFDPMIEMAAEVLVRGLHKLGFPPTHEGLEELFDGAPPACVGLGLVEL